MCVPDEDLEELSFDADGAVKLVKTALASRPSSGVKLAAAVLAHMTGKANSDSVVMHQSVPHPDYSYWQYVLTVIFLVVGLIWFAGVLTAVAFPSPGEAAAQPGEAAAQPGEAAAQSGEAAAQSGEAAAQPGAAVAQPVVIVGRFYARTAEAIRQLKVAELRELIKSNHLEVSTAVGGRSGRKKSEMAEEVIAALQRRGVDLLGSAAGPAAAAQALPLRFERDAGASSSTQAPPVRSQEMSDLDAAIAYFDKIQSSPHSDESPAEEELCESCGVRYAFAGTYPECLSCYQEH